MSAQQTGYCEFCGDNDQCSICGRGMAHIPTCWEVYNPATNVILFRTEYHWFAWVWCNVFSNYQYMPQGWR